MNKDIVAFDDTLDQMDSIDIYRAFYPRETKYTLFSNAYGSFSKICCMVGHKRSLNKSKKIKIISSIFTDLELETHLKVKTQKRSNTW